MEIREEATALPAVRARKQAELTCPFPLDQGRLRAPRRVRGEQCERHAPKSSENGLPTCSLVSARLKASAGRISSAELAQLLR